MEVPPRGMGVLRIVQFCVLCVGETDALEGDAVEAVVANACADLLELGRLAMLLPTPGLAWGVVNGTFFKDMRSIAEDLGKKTSCLQVQEDEAVSEAARLGEDGLLHSVRQDYTQLFTHPNGAKVPPFEALFLDSMERVGNNRDDERPPVMFLNPIAADVARWYESAGLRRVHDEGLNVSPDHMAVEMEFLIRLYRAVANQLPAFGTGDGRLVESGMILQGHGEASAVEGVLRGFREKHFDRWAPAFFGAIEQNASTMFYRYVAVAMQELVV